MKLHILFGQRKCVYPDQYAPEVIAAVDEYAFDENPDYIIDTAEENEESGDFTRVAIIVVSVPDEAITARLNPPELEAVAGTVEDE